MPADPSRIFDVCEAILEAVVTRHGAPLPPRQFVSGGMPAWDCELVAVWCEVTAGHAGDVLVEQPSALQPAAAHSMRFATVVVTVCRCAPLSKGKPPHPPSTDEEETAARLLYEDGQRVLNSLLAADKAGDLGGCHGVVFMGWNPLGPEGGYVAGELRVRVNLTGF